MNPATFYWAALIFLAILLWLISLFWFAKEKRLRGASSGLSLGLYLVSLPESKEEKAGDTQALKDFILKMENFLTGLGSIQRKGLAGKFFGNPQITLEIASHNRGSEIFFYVAFPRAYEVLLQNQLHGAYPDAKIERVLDYNIFNLEGASAGGIIETSDSELLPVKTYQKIGGDALETITAAFSKIKKFGEGAALQIVLRKGAEDVKKRAHAAAQKIKEGKSKKEALGGKGVWHLFDAHF